MNTMRRHALCIVLSGLTLMAVAGQGSAADRGSTKNPGGTNESAPQPAQSTSPINKIAPRPGADVVTLNFINADIEGVVKVMAEITGKNFVVDPRVKGTVTIVSARPMQRGLVYDVFLSALRVQGFSAVEDRGMVSILPETDAKVHASPTVAAGENAVGAGDRIETRIFTLKYESAAQILPVLRPLIAPNNTITAYQNNNTLVVTDYANNLQRIAKIIDSIDQPSGVDPVVVPLLYASAVDVAQTVNRLFSEMGQGQGGAEPTQRFMVVADARSNSLLVRSGDPSRLSRLRKFVSILDSPTSASGNIHVVYLKNAEAAKLAETLRAIYSGESAAPAASRPMTPSPLSVSSSASTQSVGGSTSFTNNSQTSSSSGAQLVSFRRTPRPIQSSLRRRTQSITTCELRSISSMCAGRKSTSKR
jgi:general secretion pathway protein D